MRSYIENVDFFKGNDPETLVATYGSPLYVYNEDILRSCMRTVRGLITKYDYTCNFSIKANSNLTILKIALEEGLNCDAMSEGEIRLLQKAGFTSDRIFFVPNNVSDSELKYAIDNGILVSLDSIDQIESYGKIAPGTDIAVRINPGVGAGHHQKVVTAGKNTKFAITVDKIDEMIAMCEKYDLHIIEVNQHVGSLFMDPEPFLKAVETLFDVAKRFKDLKYIDLGGGIGAPYHKVSEDEKPFDFDSFKERLEKELDSFVESYGHAPLFKMEPGRFVVCESGILLGKVYAVKTSYDRKYAGTDLGQNILVRPTLYGSWHDVEILRNGKVVADGEREKITIVGNICESGDKIAEDRELPVIKKGDIIAVLDAGAYGYSMASNYNQRPRPAEVMITSDGEVRLIRKRDTFEDLFRGFDI